MTELKTKDAQLLSFCTKKKWRIYAEKKLRQKMKVLVIKTTAWEFNIGTSS